MKKPFKETKFGKLLKEKLPQAAELVADLLPDNGVFGVVKNAINLSGLTKDEKEQLIKEATALEMEYFKMELQDKENARDREKTALGQDDIFSKRFQSYLTTGILVASFGFIFAITFIPIPEDNQRIVDMITGGLIVSGISTIIGYYYGASKSSKDREAKILTAIENVT